MVASTISGRPWRTSPIQGWARRARSGPQPIHGQKGYPAPAFFAPLTSTIVTRKSTGSATFTRATTAYVEDQEALLKQAISGEVRFTGARRVRNLVPASEDNQNAGYTVIQCSTTSSVVTYTGTGGEIYVTSINTGAPLTGRSFRFTVELTAGTATKIFVGMTDTTAWDDGVHSTQSGILTLTGTATRFSILFAPSAPTGNAISAVVGVAAHNGQGNQATGTATVTKWLVEEVTGQSNQNPSEYVSVGVASAPYHGANVDGVKYFVTQNGNTVASNVVTEATGVQIADSTLKGYLAEGARTNRCLQSEEFDNVAWTATSITVGAEVAAPDGTTTAETLTASAGNGTIIQDLGVVASATKTFSVYLKRKTGTGNIDLTMDGGATWTTKTITTSWARYSVTQTLADEDVGIRIVTNTDAIYAWGAQVETASFASSYIPTTTLAVARNGDVLTYPTGNMADAAGTAFAEVSSIVTSFGANAFALMGSASSGRLLYAAGADASVVINMYDGATVATSAVGTSYLNTNRKVASVWGRGGKMAAFFAGAKGTEQNYDGTISAGAITIGCENGSSSPWFGNIRNVRIWTSALNDQQIAGL